MKNIKDENHQKSSSQWSLSNSFELEFLLYDGSPLKLMLPKSANFCDFYHAVLKQNHHNDCKTCKNRQQNTSLYYVNRQGQGFFLQYDENVYQFYKAQCSFFFLAENKSSMSRVITLFFPDNDNISYPVKLDIKAREVQFIPPFQEKLLSLKCKNVDLIYKENNTSEGVLVLPDDLPMKLYYNELGTPLDDNGKLYFKENTYQPEESTEEKHLLKPGKERGVRKRGDIAQQKVLQNRRTKTYLCADEKAITLSTSFEPRRLVSTDVTDFETIDQAIQKERGGLQLTAEVLSSGQGINKVIPQSEDEILVRTKSVYFDERKSDELNCVPSFNDDFISIESLVTIKQENVDVSKLYDDLCMESLSSEYFSCNESYDFGNCGNCTAENNPNVNSVGCTNENIPNGNSIVYTNENIPNDNTVGYTNENIPNDNSIGCTNENNPHDNAFVCTNENNPNDNRVDCTNENIPNDNSIDCTNENIPNDNSVDCINENNPNDNSVDYTNENNPTANTVSCTNENNPNDNCVDCTNENIPNDNSIGCTNENNPNENTVGYTNENIANDNSIGCTNENNPNDNTVGCTNENISNDNGIGCTNENNPHDNAFVCTNGNILSDTSLTGDPNTYCVLTTDPYIVSNKMSIGSVIKAGATSLNENSISISRNITKSTSCNLCRFLDIKPTNISSLSQLQQISEQCKLNDNNCITGVSYICLSGMHLKYADTQWRAVDGCYIGCYLEEGASDEEINHDEATPYIQQASKLNQQSLELDNGIVCTVTAGSRSRWTVKSKDLRGSNEKGALNWDEHQNLFESNPCFDSFYSDNGTLLYRNSITGIIPVPSLNDVRVSVNKTITSFANNVTSKIKKIYLLENSYDNSNAANLDVVAMNARFIQPLKLCLRLISNKFNQSNVFIGDDSKDADFGWLARNHLCECIASLLSIGLLQDNTRLKSLFGKFEKLTLWNLTKDFSFSFDNEDFVFEKEIMNVIDQSIYLRSDHLKFRYYFCDLLNRRSKKTGDKLIVLWFKQFATSSKKLTKYYKINTFWRMSGNMVYESFFNENILVLLKEFNSWSFKLHIDFEYKNALIDKTEQKFYTSIKQPCCHENEYLFE